MGILAAGWLRDSSESSKARLLRRLRDLVRRNVQLKRMNAALASLSEELERRVSGQRDSVSALYSRIKKLDSPDLDQVLAGLLDAIAAFSQASSAAVYEYDPKAESLILLASLGPEAEAVVPMDGTVEGWVFRYDTPFSLRMAGERLNLANVDIGRSVLAYPLKVGDLPWGVLNVREMPFYRCNPVTEKNLGVVVDLSSSYIKKAVDFRDRVLRRPRNEITGLPGYEELKGILGEELERRAARGLSVSVVLVEILGFGELETLRSSPKAFALLKEFAESAMAEAESRAIAFHFKEDGQLAFVLPDLDRDGASLFGLGLAERAGAEHWLVDGESARLEIAIGMSAFPGSASASSLGADAKAEALLDEAESVLERFKAAFAEHGGRRP